MNGVGGVSGGIGIPDIVALIVLGRRFLVDAKEVSLRVP